MNNMKKKTVKLTGKNCQFQSFNIFDGNKDIEIYYLEFFENTISFPIVVVVVGATSYRYCGIIAVSPAS